MSYWIFTLVLLASPPDTKYDDFVLDEQEMALHVLEAESVIHIYEARLKTAKLELKQDKVHEEHDQEIYQRMIELRETHAVSHRELRTAKLTYELSKIEVEKDEVDIEEAEADLELAKVRKQIAQKGGKNIYLKTERIRLRRK